MKEYQLSIDNITITYFDQHPEKEHTLLFIHGNSLNKSSFIAQFNAKQFENYRLIALDLPGHGNAGKGEMYHVPFFADTLLRFMKELNLENVILVGHSLGGHIAIEVAGTDSNNLSGIAIIGCPPLGKPADLASAFLPNPSGRLLFQQELTPNEIDELAGGIAYKSVKNQVVESIEKADSVSRLQLGQSIMEENYMDELKILATINIPYAVIIGEDDSFCNLSYFEKYTFENQWRQKINRIKKGSHSPMLDTSISFNSTLFSFISEITANEQ